MSAYQFVLFDPWGIRVKNLEYLAAEYTLVTNGIHVLSLTLPTRLYKDLFYDMNSQLWGIAGNGRLKRDYRIQILRAAGSNDPVIEGDATFLVRKAIRDLAVADSFTIVALGANSLLSRRIVAYDAGSAQASKLAMSPDQMMKEVVSESLTPTARSFNSLLAVSPNWPAGIDLGITLSKEFSRRNVLEVLQEIAQASYIAGLYIAFDVVPYGPNTLYFHTYPYQRGNDRRQTGVLLSPDQGNMTDVVVTDDYTEEITYVYAGGQGEQASRAIGTAEDTARESTSPFNTIEQFIDARTTNDATALADEADAALRAGRPRITFTGKLTETDNFIYGLNYNWGDFLRGAVEGRPIDLRVDLVHVTLQDGKENVEVAFRGEI